MKRSREKQQSNQASPAAEPATHESGARDSSFPAQLRNEAGNAASRLGGAALAAQNQQQQKIQQSPVNSGQSSRISQLLAPAVPLDSADVPGEAGAVEAIPDQTQAEAVEAASHESAATGGDTESADKGNTEKVLDSPYMKRMGLRLLALAGQLPGQQGGDSGGKEPDSEGIKTDDPGKNEALAAAGVPLSFMKDSANYPKLNKAEKNYESFDQALEADSQAAAKAQKTEAGVNEGGMTAEENESVSTYSEGIIDLVKSGFQSCMKLKESYEEYQLVKDNTDEDPSKLEGAKLSFELALNTTGGALSAINAYQKSFGAAQSLAIQAAIPAISIVLSTISLIGRIVTLVQQGNLDFGKTSSESQADSILSAIAGDEKKKAEVKQVLESETFRALVIATAEYRQQERDNPKIFSEYRKSQDDPELQERLRRRYPANFARIEEIHKNNKIGLDEIGPETQKLIALGVTVPMLEAIIEDQSLINHLEEVKEKRSTNAKIGIFTDLVNIGGDIATLSGAGAVVGSAMKAGSAAIDLSRKGGNAIKFAARSKGAENFSEGAEGGLFGSSIYDNTNILKHDEAKQTRYFHSARLIVENIADHEKKVVNAGKQPNQDQVKAINKGYGWIETKILGTGASVSVVKAMANAKQKTGNDIVKYLIDKMKVR